MRFGGSKVYGYPQRWAWEGPLSKGSFQYVRDLCVGHVGDFYVQIDLALGGVLTAGRASDGVGEFDDAVEALMPRA